MSVFYEEARENVRARFEPGWTLGTFCLDDRYIVENDEFWVFSVGAREHLIDVVYKDDGRIGSLPSLQVAMDRTIRARPNPDPTVTV